METRLTFTTLQAPFAGVITERHVEPGDFVTKNRHLLTLADPPLWSPRSMSPS